MLLLLGFNNDEFKFLNVASRVSVFAALSAAPSSLCWVVFSRVSTLRSWHYVCFSGVSWSAAPFVFAFDSHVGSYRYAARGV